MKAPPGAFSLALAGLAIATFFNVGWATFESAVVWLLYLGVLLLAAIWRSVDR